MNRAAQVNEIKKVMFEIISQEFRQIFHFTDTKASINITTEPE